MRTLVTGSPTTRARTVVCFVPARMVMVVVPTLTGVTRPLPLTTATPGFELAQVTTRLVIAAPLGPTSCTPIVRVVVSGTSKLSGVATIETIGMRTLITDVASLPSARTVMFAIPFPAELTPVTTPVEASTVATPGLFDSQVNVRPVRACPAAPTGETIHWL
jgi:hypothetical protein